MYIKLVCVSTKNVSMVLPVIYVNVEQFYFSCYSFVKKVCIISFHCKMYLLSQVTLLILQFSVLKMETACETFYNLQLQIL